MKIRSVLVAVGIVTAFHVGDAQAPYRAVLYNGTSASMEQRLIALTLAGIVNRDSARLYLLNVYETWSYGQTDERWRDIYRARGHVQFDSTNNILTLVDRFRPLIGGAITYDPTRWFSNFTGQSFRWQAEYAALIGGLTNRLPVPPDLAPAFNLALNDSVLISDSFDGDPPIWVTGRLELPSHPWNNGSLSEEQRYLAMLDWGVTHLLPRCNPQKFYLREITDWAIGKRMFQVNLAGTDDLDLNSMPSPRTDILERILTFMHSKNTASIFHIYGWIRPEPMTQWFAYFGSSFHETLLGNLSWHSSFPQTPRQFVPPARVDPDTVLLQDKHYIMFVGSEGDASNWVFGFQAGAWLSPQRGAVPIAWGWNLHLFNECPFVAAYYYDTGTPGDGFLSVISPLGYAYPDLWQNEVWNGARDSTRGLMDRFGIDDIYGYKHYAPGGQTVFRGRVISNSYSFTRYGLFQSSIHANSTIVYDPIVPSQVPFTTYGALMLNHTGDGSFYGDASDLTRMANRILDNLRGKQRPGFLLAAYQRFRQDDFGPRPDPSNADISIPRLAQVVQLIKADTSIGRYIEAVTPEKFSVLMRRKVGIIGSVADGSAAAGFGLMQNYPNPFNPSTVIRFRVRHPGPVSLTVYDMLGRKVATPLDAYLLPGEHAIRWNARGLTSGVYCYRLEANGFSSTKRLLLLK